MDKRFVLLVVFLFLIISILILTLVNLAVYVCLLASMRLHRYALFSWGLRRICALGDCPGSLQLQPIPIHHHQHQRWNCSRWSRSHRPSHHDGMFVGHSKHHPFYSCWWSGPVERGMFAKGSIRNRILTMILAVILGQWPMIAVDFLNTNDSNKMQETAGSSQHICWNPWLGPAAQSKPRWSATRTHPAMCLKRMWTIDEIGDLKDKRNS